MKRPGTFTEKLAKSSNSMQPTSGGGKSSIVSPVESTLIEPKTLGGSGKLGSLVLSPETLFTALGTTVDYEWTTVTGLARMALIYRFRLAASASDNWQVQVWSEPDGAGDMMFEAVGLNVTPYNCSWPWMYVSVDTDLHIGIKNNGAVSDFSLVQLEAITIA